MNVYDDLKWMKAGRLSRPKLVEEEGTYIFILDQDRIVYVGTGVHLVDRWDKAKDEFLTGFRTMWSPEPYKDVYKLMNRPYTDQAFYRNLVYSNRAWFPNGIKDTLTGYSGCMYTTVKFTESIQEYAEKYVSRLSVWACLLPNTESAHALETKIQQRIGKAYKLGYYNNQPQNWLGRQEMRDPVKLNSYQFSFNDSGLPKVNPELKGILLAL